MSANDPNTPITNLDDFFGGGITLAQYERKDDPMPEGKQREAQPMDVNLIDMNTFLADDDGDAKDEGDGQNLIASQTQSTD